MHLANSLRSIRCPRAGGRSSTWRAGWFGTECQRGQYVCSDVECEHLQNADGEGEGSRPRAQTTKGGEWATCR